MRSADPESDQSGASGNKLNHRVRPEVYRHFLIGQLLRGAVVSVPSVFVDGAEGRAKRRQSRVSLKICSSEFWHIWVFMAMLREEKESSGDRVARSA